MVDHQQPQQQPPWEQIGSSFVHHYYKMFDTDRGQLASLYVSMRHLDVYPPRNCALIWIHSLICHARMVSVDLH